MSKEAMKLALEAMTYADACLKKQLTTKDKHQYAQDLLLEAGTAIREALAEQPARCEPAEDGVCEALDCPNHTAQRQARSADTWVGLTNNELQPIADEYRILFGSWVEDFARAIEAKLKAKNFA